MLFALTYDAYINSKRKGIARNSTPKKCQIREQLDYKKRICREER